MLHEAGAGGGVWTTEGDLAESLIFDGLDFLLGDEEGDDVVATLSLLDDVEELVDPLWLVVDGDGLSEAHAPAADVHDAGADGDAAAGVDGNKVAVVRRAGGADDVDGLESEGLAGDNSLLVDVGLEGDAALLRH